jgi:hypothetical protein
MIASQETDTKICETGKDGTIAHSAENMYDLASYQQ